jgi:hypothetical protein
MPIERAAKLVEDHLLGEAKRLTKAKKLRALLEAEAPWETRRRIRGVTPPRTHG